MFSFNLDHDLKVALVSGVIAGLVVLVIQNQFEVRREIKRAKIEVLRKIAGNRPAIADQGAISESRHELFEGLNEAAVVFSDSKIVGDALSAVLNSKGGEQPKRMVDLLKAMSKDVGINPKTDLLEQIFIPGKNFR